MDIEFDPDKQMIAKHDDTTAHAVEPEPDTPLSDDEFERGFGAMLARRARAATGLSQQNFAEQFGIPAESLRDWEQGRKAPDTAAKSYLRVIARMPEAVAKVLHDAA